MALLFLTFSYLDLCRLLRKERESQIKNLGKKLSDDEGVSKRARSATAWKVHYLVTANELAWDIRLAMAARGLLSTYAIPTISTLLRSTGGFQKDVQRRYADMELLIREFNENCPSANMFEKEKEAEASMGTSNDLNDFLYTFTGPPIELFELDPSDPSENQRAHLAILRLNAIHAQYGNKILYWDMVYVLSIFLTTPAVYCDGGRGWVWRSYTEEEKQATFIHWTVIGEQMGLNLTTGKSTEKNITSLPSAEWSCFEDCLTWRREYERKKRRYHDANKVVAFATVDYFISSLPTLIPPCFHSTISLLVLQILSILQESDEARECLGLPCPPNWFLATSLDIILTFRAFIIRFMSPPRPLAWSDRLGSRRGIKIFPSSPSPLSTGSSPSPLSTGSSCPFRMMYTPNRALDYGNTTYSIKKGYIIEEMGPKCVPKGKLEVNPRYAESHSCDSQQD